MLKGSICSLITPFTDQGEVDLQAYKDHVAWQAEESDAVVCMGTTGEAPTLTHEEQREIFKITVDVVNGKVPVIAGTGTYCTAETVRLTEEAKRLGADGCLVVVPYYNRPTPEGCFAHFAAVSKAGLPTIVYHHPGRTGVKLSPQILAQICTLPNILGVKETSGTTEITQELVKLTHVPIYSGDDNLALPMLKAGAKGIISIVANCIPSVWRKVIAAQDEQGYKEIADLVEAMVLEVNPQCVKYALNLMGKCRAHMRLPLVEPRPDTKRKILEAVKAQNLLSIENFMMV
jgi:4-hydroxy-tetrahydrodipicolinate synthase